MNKVQIDKLTLCFNITDKDIYKYLDNNEISYYEFKFFKLIREESSYCNCTYRIVYLDNENDNTGELRERVFGRLKFSSKDKKDTSENEKYQHAWIAIENYILYTPSFLVGLNRLIYLEVIANTLMLQFNNFTHLDLAKDSIKLNLPNKMKQCLRDKSLSPIINRKLVNRDEHINEIRYEHTGTIDRYTNLNMYICQKKAIKNKNNGIVCCLYNKLKEIFDKDDKYYILEAYGNPTKLSRCEIRLHNEQLNDFMNTNRIEFSYDLLQNQSSLTNYMKRP
ncbi:MAG: hypothetical protein LUH15_17425 [Tannerellaceae bacterium]|nr:hypothetical protein [Tannerellaceae bacterium]